MLRLRILIVSATFSSAVLAQPAELEVQGVFGECIPVYAAAQDNLQLYKKPDLDSRLLTIPYREGWRIEAPKREGLTRVLSRGLLRVTSHDPRMHCSVYPAEGPAELVEGELVDYLYSVGEGFGEIQFRGAHCQAGVYEDFKHFETLRLPDVQIWLKVFNADGSSPGWLLHDGSQTRVADVLC